MPVAMEKVCNYAQMELWHKICAKWLGIIPEIESGTNA